MPDSYYSQGNDCPFPWTTEQYATLFDKVAVFLEREFFAGDDIFSLNSLLFQDVVARSEMMMQQIAAGMQGDHSLPDCFKRASVVGYNFHSAKPYKCNLDDDSLDELDGNQQFVITHLHEIITILACLGLTNSYMGNEAGSDRPRYLHILNNKNLRDIITTYRRNAYSMECLRQILQMSAQMVKMKEEIDKLLKKVNTYASGGIEQGIEELKDMIINISAGLDYKEEQLRECKLGNLRLQEKLRNLESSLRKG